MATRALIGIYEAGKGSSWRATYHHWDGYPTGLGRALWRIYHDIYPGLLSAMMEFIVDAHPEGWSTLAGRDFRKRPTWFDGSVEMMLKEQGMAWYELPPLAYKYRGDDPMPADETSNFGQEWAYVFDLQSNTMTILERVSWHNLSYAEKATIPLNGMEPDWDSLK
ncbi:MAG: hypothetical protein JNJ61_25755 [Anaerolineae bacterium]|nr:hypothetical protein [Anaerolineae bacterium]